MAVSVYIRHSHRQRAGAGCKLDRRLKRAVAIAQEDGYGGAGREGEAGVGVIANHQVRLAIAVEVAYGYGVRLDVARSCIRLIIHCRLKGSIPIAEQHRNLRAAIIRNHQVECPITVEVGNGYASGGRFYVVPRLCGKSSITATE